jgi:hypothetical protein
MVEQRTENPRVPSSILGLGTIFIIINLIESFFVICIKTCLMFHFIYSHCIISQIILDLYRFNILISR